MDCFYCFLENRKLKFWGETGAPYFKCSDINQSINTILVLWLFSFCKLFSSQVDTQFWTLGHPTFVDWTNHFRTPHDLTRIDIKYLRLLAKKVNINISQGNPIQVQGK